MEIRLRCPLVHADYKNPTPHGSLQTNVPPVTDRRQSLTLNDMNKVSNKNYRCRAGFSSATFGPPQIGAFVRCVRQRLGQGARKRPRLQVERKELGTDQSAAGSGDYSSTLFTTQGDESTSSHRSIQ